MLWQRVDFEFARLVVLVEEQSFRNARRGANVGNIDASLVNDAFALDLSWRWSIRVFVLN